MHYFSEALTAALTLIFEFDQGIYTIVGKSLQISLIATIFAGITGILLGIWIAISAFPGKPLVLNTLNTLMAMPTVMIGLIFYGMLSRKGPLGDFGLLYTETAVIIGQTCLILPIIMNLSIIAVNSADPRFIPTLKTLGANNIQLVFPILSELRFVFLAAIITGFGRAIGEVGAAMMLGGNIQGVTRTMTTAIALETSKGNFELGLALGILLLVIAFMIIFVLQLIRDKH
jgi:tungstate transport system permease protein